MNEMVQKMTEPQHTPGPWHVEISPARGTLYVGSSDTWICGELENPNTPIGGEAKANANLIAAAPDMLDALKVAIGHLTGGMDGDWRECDPVEVIRAAIDKAERGAVPSGPARST